MSTIDLAERYVHQISYGHMLSRPYIDGAFMLWRDSRVLNVTLGQIIAAVNAEGLLGETATQTQDLNASYLAAMWTAWDFQSSPDAMHL